MRRETPIMPLSFMKILGEPDFNGGDERHANEKRDQGNNTHFRQQGQPRRGLVGGLALRIGVGPCDLENGVEQILQAGSVIRVLTGDIPGVQIRKRLKRPGQIAPCGLSSAFDQNRDNRGARLTQRGVECLPIRIIAAFKASLPRGLIRRRQPLPANDNDKNLALLQNHIRRGGGLISRRSGMAGKYGL